MFETWPFSPKNVNKSFYLVTLEYLYTIKKENPQSFFAISPAHTIPLRDPVKWRSFFSIEWLNFEPICKFVRRTKETLSFGHQVQKTDIFIPNPILITPGAGIGLVTSYDKIPSSMERFEEV